MGHSGELFCALLALLRRTWDRRRPPDPLRDQFSEDLGATWGSIWVGSVTEFGEFQERVGMQNYILPDPSNYYYHYFTFPLVAPLNYWVGGLADRPLKLFIGGEAPIFDCPNCPKSSKNINFS